jgi:predicted O-methyltransferase YrrM
MPINVYEAAPEWRAVDDYFVGSLFSEDEPLVAARESGRSSSMPNAEVAPNQGALLAILTKMVGAIRVLEFGTLVGYSTIWFARAVGTAGRVVTLEVDERNALLACANLERAGVSGWVDVIVGPAGESAQRLVRDGVEPFDLVFIDADKPSNPAYLEAALALTRPGSVIVIDNVVRDGAVIRDSDDPPVRGVRRVVDDIAADQRLEATALQTVGVKGWDGFLLVRRLS